MICDKCFSYNKEKNYCEDLEWAIKEEVVRNGCSWFVDKNKVNEMNQRKYKVYLDTLTNLKGFNPIDLVTPTYFLGEDS